MRPLVAHSHAGLANLYRRAGKHAEASEHRCAAQRMYREMGMTHWLEKLSDEGGESPSPGSDGGERP